jgi:hypothetical protein
MEAVAFVLLLPGKTEVDRRVMQASWGGDRRLISRRRVPRRHHQ